MKPELREVKIKGVHRNWRELVSQYTDVHADVSHTRLGLARSRIPYTSRSTNERALYDTQSRVRLAEAKSNETNRDERRLWVSPPVSDLRPCVPHPPTLSSCETSRCAPHGFCGCARCHVRCALSLALASRTPALFLSQRCVRCAAPACSLALSAA